MRLAASSAPRGSGVQLPVDTDRGDVAIVFVEHLPLTFEKEFSLKPGVVGNPKGVVLSPGGVSGPPATLGGSRGVRIHGPELGVGLPRAPRGSPGRSRARARFPAWMAAPLRAGVSLPRRPGCSDACLPSLCVQAVCPGRPERCQQLPDEGRGPNCRKSGGGASSVSDAVAQGALEGERCRH